jgi:small subunit ribosomal protein S8
MNMTDPIADMLTRIRNANQALKPEVEIPYSRLKAELAGILKREGYIQDFHAQRLETGRQVLKVQLRITGRERSIVGIRRISRPGLRKYVGTREIPRVLGGMGIAVLSTSRGLMTGSEAKKANIGGELLAQVW